MIKRAGYTILQQVRSTQEKIEAYIVNASHYYENSKETLEKKELGKAGELLWGAIAETVKALFLHDYGKPINSHGAIRDFLKKLSTVYNKEVLEKWRRSADNLHVNFYETFLDEDTFLEYYENGEQLYAFLDSKLMKSRKKKQKKSNKK